MVSADEYAKLKYPPQDGGQPGVDRNAESRHAFQAGYEFAHNELKEETRTADVVQTVEYGVKFLQGARSTSKNAKQYTVPVGAYPTISALRVDWVIDRDAVILIRDVQLSHGSKIETPWRVA